MILFKRINLLLLFLLSTTFANAQQAYKGIDDALYYEYANNEIKVCAVPEGTYSGDIEIPSEAKIIVGEEIKTLPVVGICAIAFKDCELTSISIPASVRSIGDDAFKGCTGYSVEYEDLAHMLDIDYSNGDSNPMKYAENVSIRNGKIQKEIEINQDIKPYAFRGAKWLEGITLNAGVTKIGIYAFSGCEKLASVDIETALSFGEGVFNGCQSLKEILIPSSVTKFGKAMFKQSGLEKITIETTALLSEEMFLGCEKLNNVTLHQNTTTIGKGTFAYCYSLENLPLPQGGSGLNTIGKEAFKKCTGFKTIEIPVSVVNIGESAFAECTNLTDLIIPTGSQLNNIDENAFSSNSSLKNVYSHAMVAPEASDAFDADRIGQIQLFYDGGASGYDNEPWSLFLTPTTFPTRNIVYIVDGEAISEELPVEVGQEPPLIEDPEREGWKFAGWREEIPKLMPNEDLMIHGYFTRDIIADGVKFRLISDTKEARVIGNDNPENVVIGSSIGFDSKTYDIIAIDARAFKGATNLKSVNLSNATISIGNAIFANCSALESVTLPVAALTEITDSMFYECSALSEMILPNSVTSIGEAAFMKSGIKEITLPKSITTIGKNVFNSCNNLEDVVFEENMDLSILPEYAFYGCSKLKSSFTLPASTITIKESAFYLCESLEILVLNNIKNIGSYAFHRCYGLKAITLPASTESLGDNAFSECQNVEMITINTLEPPSLETSTFSNSAYDNATLYVKDVSKYEGKDIWKNFKNIELIGESLPKLIYKLDGKDYAEVSQGTGTKVNKRSAPDEIANPKGRRFSGWIGEPNIMPNKDSVIVGSLNYQRTYIAKGTEDVLYTDSLFYGDEVSDPNELKKEGLDYTVIEPFVTMPAKDDTLYVRYTLSEQNKPTGKGNIIYNRTPQELINQGSSKTGTLKYSLDKTAYEVNSPKGTAAGLYKVYYRVEGITDHYNTEVDSLEVSIKPRIVEHPNIILGEGNFIFTGDSIKPTVTTVKNGEDIIPDTEYTVSYTNNINAGEATVVITDNDGGNYTVNGSKKFTIKKADVILDDLLKVKPIVNDLDSLIYDDGKEIKLIKAGSLKNPETSTLEYSIDQVIFDTKIPTATEAKTYNVYYRVKGDANHNNSAISNPIEVTITPKRLTSKDIEISLKKNSYTYDGTPKTPEVLSVKYGKVSFTKDVDYTVIYKNNVNAGKEAKVIISDKNGGNYIVNDSTTFVINKAIGKLKELLKQEPKGREGVIYNGAPQPLLKEKGSSKTGTLKYSLDKTNFSTTIPECTDAGTYKVYYRVEDALNYDTSDIGFLEVKISPRDIVNFTLSQTSFTYDGSEKKPEVIVKYGDTIISKDEYSVSYTDSVNAGTATVTITDKVGGNYNISGKVQYTINKAPGSVKISPIGIENLSYNGIAQKLISAGKSNTGTLEYSLDNVNYTTKIPTGKDANSYTVFYRVKGDANHYDVGISSVKVSIAKADLTISVGNYEMFEGGRVPNFSINYDGFKNKETEAVLTTKPVVSCNATNTSKTGDYTITVSGANAVNYNITYINGKLAILARVFVSGGDTSKDEDDPATYQITSSESSSTPTVAIMDDKEVSGKFAIPESVSYHDKSYAVTEIAAGAFEDNKNLTDVIIPSSITSINDNAFKGCSNLKSITVYITTPINLSVAAARGTTRNDGSSIFEGVDKVTCILYVPEGSVDLYKAAPVWSEFQHILPISTTGINGVTITDEECFDIYNMQGQKVKSKATDLKGLPRGIYIINGKKIAVK